MFADACGKHRFGFEFPGENIDVPKGANLIEIDLLPLELRVREKVSFEQIFQKRMLLTISVYLVLFHTFLHLATMVNTRRVAILNQRWQAQAPQKTQVDQLKGKLSKINEDISLIEQVVSNKVLWSPKLNRISELLISGIWLNELSLEKQDVQQENLPKVNNGTPEYAISLIIRGSAASRAKDEPALIGRFMQNLKTDPYFSRDLSEVELGPIKKRQIQQTEIMDFVLSCRFKPEVVAALLQ